MMNALLKFFLMSSLIFQAAIAGDCKDNGGDFYGDFKKYRNIVLKVLEHPEYKGFYKWMLKEHTKEVYEEAEYQKLLVRMSMTPVVRPAQLKDVIGPDSKPVDFEKLLERPANRFFYIKGKDGLLVKKDAINIQKNALLPHGLIILDDQAWEMLEGREDRKVVLMAHEMFGSVGLESTDEHHFSSTFTREKRLTVENLVKAPVPRIHIHSDAYTKTIEYGEATFNCDTEQAKVKMNETITEYCRKWKPSKYPTPYHHYECSFSGTLTDTFRDEARTRTIHKTINVPGYYRNVPVYSPATRTEVRTHTTEYLYGNRGRMLLSGPYCQEYSWTTRRNYSEALPRDTYSCNSSFSGGYGCLPYKETVYQVWTRYKDVAINDSYSEYVPGTCRTESQVENYSVKIKGCVLKGHINLIGVDPMLETMEEKLLEATIKDSVQEFLFYPGYTLDAAAASKEAEENALKDCALTRDNLPKGLVMKSRCKLVPREKGLWGWELWGVFPYRTSYVPYAKRMKEDKPSEPTTSCTNRCAVYSTITYVNCTSVTDAYKKVKDYWGSSTYREGMTFNFSYTDTNIINGSSKEGVRVTMRFYEKNMTLEVDVPECKQEQKNKIQESFSQSLKTILQ